MKKRFIRDCVSVPKHPTVVRLDALSSPEASWIEESYCITEDVRAHLAALKAAFSHPVGKGVFVIGQYGSGKSHLLAWVISKLQKQTFVQNGPQVVFVSLVNFSAANRLEEIVCDALGIPCDGGDRRIAFKAVNEQHSEGLVLVLDELSEFLRSKEDRRAFNEDVRFLQFLGEWAASRRFWIVGALQESIERTGDIEYDLYRKIKDRFPLRLILSPSHIRDLIADGVLTKQAGYDEAVAEVVRKLKRATPKGIQVDSALLSAVYPLHPATLELLEEVRDRFSSARGIIDFAVTQLAGDTERGVEPFLDRPLGDLLTPDVIIEHYADLLAIQPEFLPLSDKVFPFYEKHLGRLFDKKALKQLAERLIRLLSLVHLSRSRKGMTAAEAVYWLGFSAIQVTPEKNIAIVASTLDRLASEGQYVKLARGQYYLDTEENTASQFSKVLNRELGQLMEESETALIEEWAALLSANGVNPLLLPRDEWHAQNVKWHGHDRRGFVYVGNDEPPPRPENSVTLCIRLPFGAAEASNYHHTVVPQRISVDDTMKELVAASRVLAKPTDKAIAKRARELLDARTRESTKTLTDAYCRAKRLGPRGQSESAPLLEAHITTGAWLADNLRWALGRLYPSFDRFAPTSGPLPLETYRRFNRFLGENDIESPTSNREVNLIREAFLVPMGLLKGTPTGYHLPRTLERHELIRLADPVIENSPEPETLYNHLASPVYGLVPDQIHLFLIFLYYQGEIDITKDKRSLCELFETLPTPDKYDRIQKGGGLEPRLADDLSRLCNALSVKPPARRTVLSERQAAVRAAARCRGRVEPLTLLSVNLAAADDTEELVTRLRQLINWTHAFTENGDPLAGFAQLVFEVESITRYVDELETLSKLPERIHRVMSERDRFVHLLSGIRLDTLVNAETTVLLENLGPPPGLDAVEELEQWIRAASKAYAAYMKNYIAAHDCAAEAVSTHPAWRWTPPPLSQIRQTDLRDRFDVYQNLRNEALQNQCRGISNLSFQPTCACGFDGAVAPVQGVLTELKAVEDEIDNTLVRFFAQKAVRQKVATFAENRNENAPALTDYLKGAAPLPEISDIPALEKHLAGLQTVTKIEMTRLNTVLGGKTWSREALIEELSKLLGADNGNPIRFDAAPVWGVTSAIATWCVRQSLLTAAPLPPGIDEDILLQTEEPVDPTAISLKALAVIDQLGLPRPMVLRFIKALIDGGQDIRLPAPLSPLVESVLKMIEDHAPKDMEDFITTLDNAYASTSTLLEIAPAPWCGYLNALEDWAGLQTLADPIERLKSKDEVDWVIVDGMGLPLVPTITNALDKLLPDFCLTGTTYERWRAKTTTKGCYDAMAKAGIQHAFHKIDVIDHLIHDRPLPFEDFRSLAATELAIAFKPIARQLDKTRPLMLFADHGCRLTDDGKGLTHGGNTLLEATIPLFFLVPR